jgi:hypothetical protein
MITIEDLKQKFPVEAIAPYGDCIVIPGKDFDPDWEHYLAEQGFKCFFIDINRKPVTLVRLKTETKADSPKEVYKSEPKTEKQKRPVVPLGPLLNPESRWKPEEDELIISLWNKKHNVPEIHAELRKRFPKRTEHAVKCRVTRLIKAGKIPGRWHKGECKKKTEKTRRAGIEPATSAPSPQEPFSTPSSTPISTPISTPASTPVPFSINTTLTIQLSVNCNDRNAVANLFDIIEKMGLKKKEASA